ncbi:hypothetical protein NUW58_g5184 [Xylaria curta]|uniref:Uncharacterized protein n=1 Tax=Xylaria curta TaxID=42375 RepID=A0ACC1P2V3_9PEZI|nr:hypothetical protein NUW58_g5184 [Xylaria curta]
MRLSSALWIAGLSMVNVAVTRIEGVTLVTEPLQYIYRATNCLQAETVSYRKLEIARKAGVEMPRLQSMYALLRSMQETREGAKAKTKEKL